MPRGHIKLGLPGELRDYLLMDPKMRNKQLANPMAAKIGQGLGTYDDYQNYAGWVMSSWEAGIGKKNADEGGALYSELDTRFASQVILPPYYDFQNIAYTGTYVGASELFPEADTVPLTIGATGGAHEQIALLFQVNSPEDAISRIFIPIYGNSGISVTAQVYSDISAHPSLTTNPAAGVNWGSATAVLDGELGLNHYSFNISEQTITTGTYAWIILKPTTPGQTFTMPVKDTIAGGYTMKKKTGATWTDGRYKFFHYVVTFTGGDPLENIAKIEIYENPTQSGETQTAWFCGTDYVSWWDGAAEGQKLNKTVGNVIDMCAFGDTLWIAKSSTADALTYVQSTDTLTTKTGIKAHMFARWAGYLWRAYLNDVWYTVDGSTWYGPFQIGPDGYQVRGMAGLGDDMFISTDEGLYRVGAGDRVYGVTRWNQISPENGAGMIHHQGAIYIPVGLDLFQFNGSQVLPIGLNREEGLPQYKQGRVVSLCSHNYWLIALVRASDETLGWSTVWAWNQQGWHYMATLPRGTVGNGLAWDVTSNALWVGASETAMRIYLPQNAENPYRDSAGTAKFNQCGYFATNWFFGGLKEVHKDWESVYIAGENITADRYVDVYYQDDDSTDWEYLGRVTSNRQEIRWSDYATRPNSRQLKLAIVLTTDDYSQTPVVNAVRVKYQPMVSDRWRWTLPISVTDNAQMPDNSNSPYTAQQLTVHLDMLLTRVAPFIFEDVDELRYEVKILSGGENLQTWDLVNGIPKLEKIYNLVIEQTTIGTYSG